MKKIEIKLDIDLVDELYIYAQHRGLLLEEVIEKALRELLLKDQLHADISKKDLQSIE